MKYVCLFLLFLLTHVSVVFAESISEKAKHQRSKNISYLVFLEYPVKNFGSAQERKQYVQDKFNYSKALSFYFEHDFRNAYYSFVKVLESLEKVYEKISIDYISRTNLILQGSVRALVDIDIGYHPKSDVVDRMLRDIEPPYEKPYYEEAEFHFTYDKRPMTANMNRAYFLLGLAKKLRQYAVNLEKYLEPGKPVPVSYREKRVEAYKKVVELCRQAKINGLYVYGLINRNKILKAEDKYRKNPTFLEEKIDPVFDPRVPEEYVLDLNDAMTRMHNSEVKYKIELKRYDVKGADKKK